MNSHNKHHLGAFSLTLVFIVTFVLTLIILAVQGLTLLSIRLGKSETAEKVTYYAAEGLIFDTLARLNQPATNGSSNWPPNVKNRNYRDSPPGPENTDITRKVSYDSVNRKYLVDITATSKDASRRLVASISDSAAGGAIADIMLVIDISGSMQSGGNHSCAGWNNVLPPAFRFSDCSPYGNKKIGQPVYAAQSAAESFIKLILNDTRTNSANIQTGLITYENYAKLRKPLDNDHQKTITNLQSLEASGGTNIHHALQRANQQFATRKNPNPNSKQIIILLTDGLPNKYNIGSIVNTTQYQTCRYTTHSKPGEPWYDQDLDKPCVTKVISEADALKSTGAIIYVIGLGLRDTDYHAPLAIEMGKHLLQTISSQPPSQYTYFLESWKDWSSPFELELVYSQIFEHIISTQILKISECPSGGACP